MKIFKRCCTCGKTIWPGQQSKMGFSPIHHGCHQENIRELCQSSPDMAIMVKKEINEFESETGVRTGLLATLRIDEVDLVEHMRWVGERGYGKTRYGPGSQPTEEQIERERREEQDARLADEKRLQMVRDAYWEGSGEHEFDGIYNAIAESLDVDEPTTEQVHVAFNLLPAEIIGAGVQWGFSDTVVREEAWGYIEENQATVRAALGLC